MQGYALDQVRKQEMSAGARTSSCFMFPLLDELLGSALVHPEDWDHLSTDTQASLTCHATADELLPALVAVGLLTEYQATRIHAGKTFGLLLGNYRVLDRLGSGSMGVVYRGEHIDLRRQVAIKVLCPSHHHDPHLLQRFTAEMRAVAQLQHPNIVAAVDAGRSAGPRSDTPTLHYFVMEYVPGQDLENHVKANGPLPLAKACDLAHQLASALAEAHHHGLVHRDIKPSNIRVTPEGQAKLLDFGLARHLRQRMTEPGTFLGTLDFIAPEQARDAGAVDVRADIYSLGATLYWSLTGQLPFAPRSNMIEELLDRLTQPPPSVRGLRPDLPPELDAVVARMMALEARERHATPQAVMEALVPFLRPEMRDHEMLPAGGTGTLPLTPRAGAPGIPPVHQVLIVDDDAQIRSFCRFALASEGLHIDEAEDGLKGLEALQSRRYDLVILDIDMPNMKGTEVCRRLRESPPLPHLKILMVSGRASADELSEIMLSGADDYLTKPFSFVQLQARSQAALRLKDAQDHSDALNHHLLALNHELEVSLSARDSDLVQARNALVLGLAELVGYRDSETGSHLMRLQHYCRILAEEAAQAPLFAGQIDVHFVEMLACCAPLHDIGKAGLPDHILQKPGKLTPEERIIMQTHTMIGADTLQKVAQQHGFARAFLQMAIEIARHHHERYDGRGYPDGLAGDNIPLSARIVALADVYDALRSRRVYKPALSHATAVRMMLDEFPGHFDPTLAKVFERCASKFEHTFSEFAD